MPYDPNDAKSVYLLALEIKDAADRAAFVARACDGKPDLQARVENLIKASLEPDSLIDSQGEQLGCTPMDDSVRPDRTVDYDKVESITSPALRLSGYKVLEVIGRGGMGVVLRALDEKLNRVVAIKVLAADLAGQPQARKRFLREAQAAAAVSHDHVVTIHAVDDGLGESNTPFIVMECIVGQSLQQKIDRVGALQVKEILRIGMQIAFGLAAAHKQGIVHRDIKPSNILLENGVERVKITDFGLARATDDIGMTVSGQIAGTPQYMSPEQATGQPIDQRSDLFSLGSILYAMCTGRPPFRADSAVAVLRRVCDDTPRAIDVVNPEIPDWLISIIARLMAKRKEDRFQSADEVASILECWLAHLQQPESVPRPALDSNCSADRSIESRSAAPIVNRWRYPAMIIGLCVLGVLVVLGTGRWMGFDAYDAKTEPKVSSEEIQALERMLELALKDLGDAKLLHASHSTSVNAVTEAEVRVAKAELQLAESIGDSQRVDRCVARLVGLHEKLLEYAQRQYEAGLIPETEVRRTEAALLEIRRRSTATRGSAQ